MLRNLARLRLEVYLQVREPPLHFQWSHLKQQEVAVLVDPLVNQAGWVLIEEPGGKK